MKKEFADGIKNLFRLDAADDEYEEEYEETEETEELSKSSDRKSKSEDDEKKETKVFRSARKRSAGNTVRAKIVGFQPEELDDRSEIADSIKANNIVLVDYSKNSEELMNRINDYLYGVVYSLDSKFVIVSSKIVLITPEDISISGKFYK